jgi:hypothetical protein
MHETLAQKGAGGIEPYTAEQQYEV